MPENCISQLSPSLREKHERIIQLIQKAQSEDPFSYVGQIWAQPVSQTGWCNALGMALRTFQKLIGVPLIRKYRCLIDGRTVTLLRVGAPGEEAVRAKAQAMRGFYQAHCAKRGWGDVVSRDAFGMLCGLARDLPDGREVAVFKHVVRWWPDFMDVARFEIEAAIMCLSDDGDPFHPDALGDHTLTTARRFANRRPDLSLRVYRRPFIPFLRAFWPVATEVYIDFQEERGHARPPRIWHQWSRKPACAEPPS